MADPMISKISVGDGATFFPSVDGDGVISWTNNKNLPNPASADLASLVAQSEPLQSLVAAIRSEYGHPFVAATAADMTDHSKIYVYVGSEAGYTFGHWYYYDGAVWTDGGAYNSTALVTDATLSVSGEAADALATGNAIEKTKAEMSLFSADDLLWDNTNPASKTQNGVTYTVDAVNKTVTIATGGNASTGTALLTFFPAASVPAWLQVGKTYYVHMHTNTDAYLRVSRKINGSWNYTFSTKSVTELTLNSSVTDISIEIVVTSGKTINTVVRPFISETLSLSELESKINDVEDVAITNIGTIPSCDLNDITGNIVGLLTTYNTYTNLPFVGFYGTIYNIATSSVTAIQYAFSFNTGALYYRRYTNSNWGDWVVVNQYDDSNTMHNKGTIPNNTDLNDLVDTGFYGFQYGYNYSNLPDGIGNVAGVLSVYKNSANVQHQTIYTTYPQGSQYIRICVSGTWHDWISAGSGAYAVSGKYVAFGDSLTKGAVWTLTPGDSSFTANKKYQIPTRIALATGFVNNFANEGVGGIGYVHESGGETITGKILNYDFTDVQLVTIMGGANDVDGVVELGTSASTAGDGTICGAIKSIIDYIKTNYPKTQVVFIQMCPVSSSSNSWTNMYYGKFSLTTYDEQVSALCHNNHVGYVNWWESLYVDTWASHSGGYNGAIGPNYSHPNTESDYALLGDFIAGKVSSLCKGLN